MAKTNKNDIQKGVGLHARRVIAYVVLIIISFFCLFWFYIMFINATMQFSEIKRTVTIRIYRDSKYKPVKKLEQSGARNASNLVWNVQQSDHRRLLSSALYIFLNHDCICDPCV